MTPKEFNGVPATTGDPLVQRVRSYAASGAADPKAFAATYGTTPSTGYVVVMGYQRHDFVPSWSLDDAIGKAAASDRPLPAMRSADPGPRGGAMKCALQSADQAGGFPGGVCLWADGSMQAMFSEVGTARSLDLDRVEADARAFRRLAEQPT